MNKVERQNLRSVVVNISTSAAKQFAVYRAEWPVRLRRIALLPEGAWSADASNYWVLAIDRYTRDRVVRTRIPITDETSTYSLAANSLTVGIPVLLPHTRFMDEFLREGESIYLDVSVGAGSPSALAAKAQVDFLIGGR